MLKKILKECSINFTNLKAITDNQYQIDDRYLATLMNDGRWVILELGKELFPPRGKDKGSKFTNKAKFAKWKWVYRDGFIREWPENLIDSNTGDVIKHEFIYMEKSA